MKLVSLICGLLPLASAAAIGGVKHDDYGPEHDANVQNLKFKWKYWENVNDILSNRTEGCTLDNVEKRIEWESLDNDNKAAYIAAIKCLHSKPAFFDQSVMSGAKSRYDDFTATHLLQTPFIHFDGLFLGFHRKFVHLFDQALRGECGYTGPIPYWDWSQWYDNPFKSTFLMEHSDVSFGGNGEYIPNRQPIVLPLPGGPTLTFPPATGGGCVQSGPFQDGMFDEHLGPVVLDPKGPLNGTGYNPRCISRDVNKDLASNVRPSNVTKLLKTTDLEGFNILIDDPLGLHTSAHFMMGGIQMDPFASPSDPYFWPHHGMIDYLWTVWQGQDMVNRPGQVSGTINTGNPPGSPAATLDSLVNFEVLTTPSQQPIRAFISSIDGPFCYIYV